MCRQGRRERRGSGAGWWSGPRGRGAPAPWWPPPGWRDPAGLGRWSGCNADRHKLALLLAGTVLCKRNNDYVDNKLLSEKFKPLLCKRLGFPVFQLRKPLHCQPGSVNLRVVSGVSVITSARTSCTTSGGPVRPFVPPLVCLFALKIWITYLQAYLPYLMNHQKTHQTNPMAPWDPLDAPLDPLRPPAPPSSTP